MRLIKGFVAGVMLIGSIAAANATPTTWVDTIDFNPDKYIPSHGSFSYTHDIRDNGYTPLVDPIFGYSLSVDLYDDGDQNSEIALVEVPNLFGQGNQVFFDLSGAEFGGWSLAGYLELTFTDLYDMTVASLRGDFYLGSSTLTVRGDDRHSVPEPGALALLGLGLLGVGLASRKKLKLQAR